MVVGRLILKMGGKWEVGLLGGMQRTIKTGGKWAVGSQDR